MAEETTYAVVCRGDRNRNPDGSPGAYQLATRTAFVIERDAASYAKGIDPSREALVVPGDWRGLRFDDPVLIHDCKSCVFLGHLDPDETALRGYDLYYCDKGHRTVIGRFGDEPHEYTSGIPLAGAIPVLGIALSRATKRGLYKPPAERD